MQSADAATPAPTYGMPASSSRPWTVPSSPKGPCRIGQRDVDRAERRRRLGVGDDGQAGDGVLGDGGGGLCVETTLSPSSAACPSPAPSVHRPLRSIATVVTS